MERSLSYINSIKSYAAEKRGSLFILFKMVTAAALLYFIISYIKPGEIKSALLNSDPLLLIAASALLPLNLFFQYRRWKTACGALLKENNGQKIFYSLFYGFSAGVFTPLRIGEYFGRAIPFKDKKLLDVTLASAADKIFPMLMVIGAGIPAALLFLYFKSFISPAAALFLAALYLLIIVSAIYFLLTPSGSRLFFGRLRNAGFIRKLSVHLEVLKRIDRASALKILYNAAGQYTTFTLQYALLAAAFSPEYNFLYFLWAGMLVMFGKTIIPPVTIGELGIRESASVLFLTQLGGTAAAAFNASMLLFIINLLLPSAAGMIMLLKNDDR